MQEMAVSTKMNGVDVERLFETIHAIKQTPRLADFKFSLQNRWINCGLNRSTITNFYDNLTRLKIQPDRIVGGHGNRIGTMADLNALAGKK